MYITTATTQSQKKTTDSRLRFFVFSPEKLGQCFLLYHITLRMGLLATYAPYGGSPATPESLGMTHPPLRPKTLASTWCYSVAFCLPLPLMSSAICIVLAARPKRIDCLTVLDYPPCPWPRGRRAGSTFYCSLPLGVNIAKLFLYSRLWWRQVPQILLI